MDSYIVLGAIGFGITYAYTNQYDLSLFTALVLILGKTLFRYIVLYEDLEEKNYGTVVSASEYVIGIGICLAIIYNKNNIIQYTKLTNFLIVMYIFGSMLEWITHKNIMHNTSNETINSIVDSVPYFKIMREHHMEHHIHTYSDMTVTETREDPTNDVKLRMSWDIFIPIIIALVIFGYIAKYITRYNIEFIPLLIGVVLAAFTWSYIWNKTHAAMHELDYDYSLTKGPHDNGLLNIDFIYKAIYHNHEAHHFYKGEKKGNFNVVVFGADEWLGSNNKSVDHTEYCRTHSEDKTCKEIRIR